MLHVSEREQKVSIACAILLGVILGILLPLDGANWITISIFTFYFIIVELIVRLRGTLQLNIDTESKVVNSKLACFMRWWWLLILLVVLWDISFVLKHITNTRNSDDIIHRLNYQAFIPSIILLFVLIILGVVLLCRRQGDTSPSPEESRLEPDGGCSAEDEKNRD